MSIESEIQSLELELTVYEQNKPAGMDYPTFLKWNKGVKSLKSKITRRERKLKPIMPKAEFDALYKSCYDLYNDYHIRDIRQKYADKLSEWQDNQLAQLEGSIWRNL